MKIDLAAQQADYFLQRLRPGCHRIEIVGSLKRQDKQDVHDIEFLLIPKDQKPVPEFGKPNQLYKTVLEKILADLHYEDKLRHAMDKKDGDRYKKRAICGITTGLNEFCIDLFIVTPATWGIQNVIRTGPALFGHRYVANRNQTIYSRELNRKFPGLLPNHFEYIKAKKDDDTGTAIRPRDSILNLELPEETNAIELLGLGWIPPQKRGYYALNK